MNVAAALAVLVQTGVFEKIPKEGSITAKELGTLVNLEPSVIGASLHSLSTWSC